MLFTSKYKAAEYIRLSYTDDKSNESDSVGNLDTARDSSGDDLAASVKNIMNEAYCRDISVKTRSSLDIKRTSSGVTEILSELLPFTAT